MPSNKVSETNSNSNNNNKNSYPQKKSDIKLEDIL